MRVVVFHCGRPVMAPPEPVDLETVSMPSPPTKSDIDPHLGNIDRVIVVGTDADLAAVVVRLLRKGLLGTVSIGFVPIEMSVAAKRWQLPARPADAFLLGLNGHPSPVPLIRDDAGGVLIGQGVLAGMQGEAYCDERRLLRGKARAIVVEPTKNGVGVCITTGLIRRKRITASGRAFQIGCHPTEMTLNGKLHPRPIRRWTWYRHTEDLMLVTQDPKTTSSEVEQE